MKATQDIAPDGGFSYLLPEFGTGNEETWREQAACRDMNPGIFYPEKNSSSRFAKAICEECVVRTECLDYALVHQRKDPGIWGGLTQAERTRIKILPAIVLVQKQI